MDTVQLKIKIKSSLLYTDSLLSFQLVIIFASRLTPQPLPFAGFAAKFLSTEKNAARRIRHKILSAKYPLKKIARRTFSAYKKST